MVWNNCYVQEQCKICLTSNTGTYIKLTWCRFRSIFVQWLQRYDVNMKAHIVVVRQTMNVLTHLCCAILSRLINSMPGLTILTIYLHIEAEPNWLPVFQTINLNKHISMKTVELWVKSTDVGCWKFNGYVTISRIGFAPPGDAPLPETVTFYWRI